MVITQPVIVDPFATPPPEPAEELPPVVEEPPPPPPPAKGKKGKWMDVAIFTTILATTSEVQ